MRTRLTKNAMELNDCPTTMDAPHKNPELSKYETGNPESWNEGVNMDHPWDEENAKGREETGHPKMKTKGANTYASMVHEAKELEAKALRCLKLSETILPDAPADVIERQAVDFMTMSNKSVFSTLRRMREFDEVVSEARVAKIVDAVMEVIAEDAEEKKEEVKEEKKEEVKAAAKEEKEEVKEEEDKKVAFIVEAVLKALAAEEKKEEVKEEKKEEVKEAAAEEKKEEVKEEKKEEVKEAAKEEKEEVKEEKKEEVKEAAKEEKEEVKEEKKEEVKEAAKEEKEEEKEEMKEEVKAALEVSFDEIGDVMASQEDVALLSQLFTAKEEEEKKEEVKEAKIKTLKNITASKEDEIDRLSSLWMKE